MIILQNLDSVGAPHFSQLSVPNKRWHSAFVYIYCSRALLSVFKDNSLPDKKDASFVDVDLKPDIKSKVDQATLTKLVEEKKIESLQNIGGVYKVASTLETNVECGIQGDVEDIACRHEAFGSNKYKTPPTKSFFHFVVEEFKDHSILINLGSAASSLAFGIKENGIKQGWYDGGSIFVALFLVSVVSAIFHFRQNRQFDKLTEVSNKIQIDVVRAGRRQQISIFEIVVGDVIFLKIGDQVPADGLFLDGHSLQVDESSMTGESDRVEVNCSHPFLLSGTKVINGNARMLVTSVGMNTKWGEMMSTISSRNTNHQTPLQTRLKELTSSIGKLGLAVAFHVLIILFYRYFTGNIKDENGNKEFNGSTTKVYDILNAVVSILAAAITIVEVVTPKGFPMAVKLTQIYSMKKMMADQAMVRKLSACETIGSITTICTDKTGTLTLNKMKVTKFWQGKAPATYTSIAPYILELLQGGVALNTTGSVYRPTSGSEIEFSGSPTEQAILSWAVLELNMEVEQLTQSHMILYVEAFNSQRNRSGVITRRKTDNTIHVHWKGAAEMILKMCSSYYDASGIMKDLGDSEKMKFEQRIQGMAASSLRCIAFAHKQISEEDQVHDMEQKKIEEDGLTLLGLVGIKDPCRPGVKKAVEDCQHAGVNIKMITGDNVFTAKAIATECGILRFDHDMSGAVVKGIEFRNYTLEERMEKVDKICVLARSSTFDKLVMVKCLKQKGHVVAVTRHCTNDSPALKEADVGLFMGIQGTEVAKESSDIVILDDNFASVAKILRWGRCVYKNIQKFIQFQLTVNVAAITVNLVVVIYVSKGPLIGVQLLWVNLITHTLGALTLATEQPTKELMTKPPVDQTKPLITNIMWRNLIAQTLYQIVVLLILQFKGESIFSVTKKVNDTLIFTTFVLCKVFNEFNARKLKKKNVFEGILRNKLFMEIIAITIVLQVVMVELLTKFTGSKRLNWGQWGT